MSTARIVGALCSLVLHAALVVPLLLKPVPPPPRPVPVTVPGGDNDMRLLPSEDGKGLGANCPRTYRGVGITISLAGRVSEIVAGGPAAHSALQLGDQLMNDQIMLRDRYAIGRVIVLRVERDGQMVDVPVRIGLICYALESEFRSAIPHLNETP